MQIVSIPSAHGRITVFHPVVLRLETTKTTRKNNLEEVRGRVSPRAKGKLFQIVVSNHQKARRGGVNFRADCLWFLDRHQSIADSPKGALCSFFEMALFNVANVGVLPVVAGRPPGTTMSKGHRNRILLTNQARLRADVPLSTYVFKSLNHFSSDGVGWNFSTNHYLEHRIRSIILESNIIQDIQTGICNIRRHHRIRRKGRQFLPRVGYVRMAERD